jgi:hypothetical protein
MLSSAIFVNNKEYGKGIPLKYIIYGQILNECLKICDNDGLLQKSSKEISHQLILVDNRFLKQNHCFQTDIYNVPIKLIGELDVGLSSLDSYLEVTDYNYLGDLAYMEITDPIKKVLVRLTCRRLSNGIWQPEIWHFEFY